MTKEELKKIIFDNFYNKEKDLIDLNGLDFGSTAVDIGSMKASTIFQDKQQAKFIFQNFSKAEMIVQNNNDCKDIRQ